MATRYLDIAEDFSATKQNPVVIHTWKVWKNHKGQIVCLSHSKANPRRVWVFPFQPGRIGFYNGTDNAYAYFRPKHLQDLLDEFGITKIVRQDPNREYQLRRAKYGGGRSEAEIYTDGKAELVEIDYGRTQYWEQMYPGTSAWESWQTFRVEGATFAIVDQIYDECGTYSRTKIIYTLEDIFNLKEKIKKALNEPRT